MTRNMLGGPFCQLCSILRERTVPFRSDRRSRLRARLPERVLQRKCLDLHTGIEDPLRRWIRRRITVTLHLGTGQMCN
jgi:hypothetical protein